MVSKQILNNATTTDLTFKFVLINKCKISVSIRACLSFNGLLSQDNHRQEREIRALLAASNLFLALYAILFYSVPGRRKLSLDGAFVY